MLDSAQQFHAAGADAGRSGATPDEVARLRARLWEAGFRPVALYTDDKRPFGRDWQIRARRNPPEAAVVVPRPDTLNTGALCDGLRPIDLDVDDPALADRLEAMAIGMFGPAPVRWRENSGRRLLAYRAAEGEPPKRVITGTGGKVEVLGHGQQMHAFGRHPSGAQLHWRPEPLGVVARDALPAVTEDQIGAFLAAAAPLIGTEPPKRRGAGSDKAKGQRARPEETTPAAELRRALGRIPNDGPPDWERFNLVGMAVFAASGGSDEGLALFREWAASHPDYAEGEIGERWRNYRRSPPGKAGMHTLRRLAADGDVLLTEHGVAEAFAERHRDRLRFCHDTGAWFIWTGSRWQQDRKTAAFSFARDLVAEANGEADFKTKAITGKASFAGGVERFARSDQTLAVTADAWDHDPWLLGTPDGVVDLRTGELRPARLEDMITRTTAVAPAATIDCPRWLQFLDEVTAGDRELIRFMQQWAGYCLTGDTREEALLFIHGPGGNGKGKFLGTLQGILGAYCKTAAMETFTASQGDRHPTDLAMLRGARMVCTSETEEGRAWAEVRIKQMTGNDVITARFMRQDFFEYRPQFKLTIIGNHKPVLKNVDDAARRRFNIVPFNFKPNPKDPQLEEKLRHEWPGILRWMIEGCLGWQKNGLIRPKVVVEETAKYFEQQDRFGAWMAERCTLDPNLSSRPGALLTDFNAWAERNCEAKATRATFRGWAEHQPGFRYKLVRGVDYLQGIGLRADGEGGGGGRWTASGENDL